MRRAGVASGVELILQAFSSDVCCSARTRTVCEQWLAGAWSDVEDERLCTSSWHWVVTLLGALHSAGVQARIEM